MLSLFEPETRVDWKLGTLTIDTMFQEENFSKMYSEEAKTHKGNSCF
jgi:hypothetical protein